MIIPDLRVFLIFFKYALRLEVMKGTLGSFWWFFFRGRYPGGGCPGCWDKNPAPYHFATLTPKTQKIIEKSHRIDSKNILRKNTPFIKNIVKDDKVILLFIIHHKHLYKSQTDVFSLKEKTYFLGIEPPEPKISFGTLTMVTLSCCCSWGWPEKQSQTIALIFLFQKIFQHFYQIQ